MNMEPGKTAPHRGKLIPNPKLKLREQFHEVMRFKYFSQRTEEACCGYDLRTVQDLPGHQDVSTTQLYTHVMQRPGLGVRSPLDNGTGIFQRRIDFSSGK